MPYSAASRVGAAQRHGHLTGGKGVPFIAHWERYTGDAARLEDLRADSGALEEFADVRDDAAEGGVVVIPLDGSIVRLGGYEVMLQDGLLGRRVVHTPDVPVFQR